VIIKQTLARRPRSDDALAIYFVSNTEKASLLWESRDHLVDCLDNCCGLTVREVDDRFGFRLELARRRHSNPYHLVYVDLNRVAG
jgi:hypothetical protein